MIQKQEHGRIIIYSVDPIGDNCIGDNRIGDNRIGSR